jgi:hypothetical protein
MTKNLEKVTAEKSLIFLPYPLASIKDVQVTEEAFTSKHEIS